MKSFKKSLVVFAILIALVLSLTACGGSVSREKAEEVENYVRDSINSMFESYGIADEDIPEAFKGAIDNVPTNVVAALNKASITDAEVDEILNAVDVFGEAIYAQDEQSLIEASEVLAELAVSDEKIATLIYEMIAANREILAVINSENDNVLKEELKLYDDVVANRADFILAMTTVMELSRVGDSLYDMPLLQDIAEDGMLSRMPTKTEILDIYEAYKSEVISMLNILDSNNMRAIASVSKIYAGYAGRMSGGTQQEINKVNALIDQGVADFGKSRATMLAVLNYVTDAKAEAFYDAVLAQGADNPAAATVIAAKAMDAGIKAEGGLDKAAVKKIAIDLANLDDYNYKSEVGAVVDDVYVAVAQLVLLNEATVTESDIETIALAYEFAGELYNVMYELNVGIQYSYRIMSLTIDILKADYIAAGYVEEVVTSDKLNEMNEKLMIFYGTTIEKIFVATYKDVANEIDITVCVIKLSENSYYNSWVIEDVWSDLQLPRYVGYRSSIIANNVLMTFGYDWFAEIPAEVDPYNVFMGR